MYCRGERGLWIGDQGLSNGEGGANPDGRGFMGDGFCRPLPAAAPFAFRFLLKSSRLRRCCTTSVWTSTVSRRRLVSTLWGSTARVGSMRTDTLNFVPGTYTKHFVPTRPSVNECGRSKAFYTHWLKALSAYLAELMEMQWPRYP